MQNIQNKNIFSIPHSPLLLPSSPKFSLLEFCQFLHSSFLLIVNSDGNDNGFGGNNGSSSNTTKVMATLMAKAKAMRDGLVTALQQRGMATSTATAMSTAKAAEKAMVAMMWQWQQQQQR
jgi:hypothetical protein